MQEGKRYRTPSRLRKKNKRLQQSNNLFEELSQTPTSLDHSSRNLFLSKISENPTGERHYETSMLSRSAMPILPSIKESEDGDEGERGAGTGENDEDEDQQFQSNMLLDLTPMARTKDS